jgi:hypothetical protein
MKLATPAELIRVTGMKEPEEQLRVLNELGIRPIFTGGQVRVYEEVIARAMLSEGKNNKPKMNI